MSKDFGGRGRGWLNLNKNNNKSAPGFSSRRINRSAPSGNPLPPMIPVGSPPKYFIQCVNEDTIFVDTPDYECIANVIRQLNVDDDGIKFNQKMKHLLEKWTERCTNTDDVEKSFHAIYRACLHDDELASKLVHLVSSRTFISREVQNKNIRLLFLSQLQKNVDGSGSLHETNPVAFRNGTRMLGEFFNKARFLNGDRFSFMAAPLVGNLQVLLENAHPQDLQLLATQLYMNGPAIKAECPEQLTKLLNEARIMLLSNELTQESKLWLLLCVDGANNTFGLLSADLHKFYLDHIGDAASTIIQRASSILIQTSQNKKFLNRYLSNINVLQVSNPMHFCTDNSSHFCTSNTYTSGFVSDSSSTDSSADYLHSGNSDRPIVGVGARLIRCNTNAELAEANSTSRGGKSGWDGKTRKTRRRPL